MPPPWVRRVLSCLVALLLLSTLVLGAAADEKKRVPKPPEPRYKPPPPGQTTPESKHEEEESDDDSGSFFDNCASGCLTGFFEALFFRSKPAPPPPAPAPAPQVALRSESVSWAAGDTAWLWAPAGLDSVELRADPGRPDEAGLVTGRLPHGALVAVLGTHSNESGLWLRVHPVDVPGPGGWVADSLASSLPPPPLPPPPPPRRPPRVPRWGFQLAAGGCGVGPADLNVEYSDGGFRGEVQCLRYLPRQWESGVGLGVRNLLGRPRVNYETPTVIDEPTKSRLQTFDLGVRAGQRYGDRSGFRFNWLLGPSLVLVRELADVRARDAATGAVLGTRQERLTRLSGGADVRLGLGWHIRDGFDLGLQATGFAISWRGKKQESLTTDFVRNPIHGFDVAVTVTLPAP